MLEHDVLTIFWITPSINAHVQRGIFTWKKILRGKLIYEKLDIVIFAQLFPNYLVTNGPFKCSDHAFVLLNTDPAHPLRRDTNFKYQHSRAQY